MQFHAVKHIVSGRGKISDTCPSRCEENKWQAAAAETAFDAPGEQAVGTGRKLQEGKIDVFARITDKMDIVAPKAANHVPFTVGGDAEMLGVKAVQV